MQPNHVHAIPYATGHAHKLSPASSIPLPTWPPARADHQLAGQVNALQAAAWDEAAPSIMARRPAEARVASSSLGAGSDSLGTSIPVPGTVCDEQISDPFRPVTGKAEHTTSPQLRTR